MTVAQLIARLSTMPGHAEVMIVMEDGDTLTTLDIVEGVYGTFEFTGTHDEEFITLAHSA